MDDIDIHDGVVTYVAVSDAVLLYKTRLVVLFACIRPDWSCFLPVFACIRPDL